MPGDEQVRGAVIGLVVAYILHHLCPRGAWLKVRRVTHDGGVEDGCVSLNYACQPKLKGGRRGCVSFHQAIRKRCDKWSPEPQSKANRRPCG